MNVFISMRYYFLFLIAIFIAFSVSAADKSAAWTGKDSTIHVMDLPIAELESGQHLLYARLYSLSQFVCYYIETGVSGESKKYGLEHTRIIYADKDYTYFVRQVGEAYIIRFIKVRTAELEQINLEQLDGKQIRTQFIKEVIPEEDKLRVQEKTQAGIDYYGWGYTYQYIPDTKQLEIDYHWKVRGGQMGTVIINKRYRALYNPESKQFSDIVISSGKKKKLK